MTGQTALHTQVTAMIAAAADGWSVADMKKAALDSISKSAIHSEFRDPMIA